MWENKIKPIVIIFITLMMSRQLSAQENGDATYPVLSLTQTPVELLFISSNNEGVDLQMDRWEANQVYHVDSNGFPIAMSEGDTTWYNHRLLYENVYDNIDMIVNIDQISSGKIKVKFVVFPGADPNQIEFDLKGSKALEILEEGSVQSESSSGWLFMENPKVYQEYGCDQPVELNSTFQIKDSGISFELKEYDPISILTIEFDLEWIPEITGTLPTAFFSEENIQIQ